MNEIETAPPQPLGEIFREENHPPFSEIPDKLGPHCDRLLAEDVRKRLDYEEINNVAPDPGVCRFCKQRLPIERAGPMGRPVFQCDKAARLWPAAERLHQERLERVRRERKEALEARQRQKPQSYF